MPTQTLSASPPARLVALYLPQFYPIPQNETWWGPGFTEWTNVTRARPLFPGHVQPHLPAHLSFYDLRVPETRQAQADLARTHGIEAFCYWHYWFGGTQLLDRPFNEVLRSGAPDFPFCLAWANQSWTGIWHGLPDDLLIEQTYPGIQDHTAHFYALLPAFQDPRYLCVDGEPVFVVYRPHEMPEPLRFTDHWRELALREGLKGLHLIGVSDKHWSPAESGYDACTLSEPGSMIAHLPRRPVPVPPEPRPWPLRWRRKSEPPAGPTIYWYKDLLDSPIWRETDDNYPCVIPNWDNTPRSGVRGTVFLGSTPELFRRHLQQALAQVAPRPPEHRLIFIKSWNEWAEGNYLEPDQEFGLAYLEAVRPRSTVTATS